MLKHLYILTIVIVVILASCSNHTDEPVLIKFKGSAQGTTYHISILGAEKDTLLKEDINRLLDSIDMSLSIYKENSIISRINRNDTTVLADTMFIEVFQKSIEISKATDGAFDATVAPLVNYWGFGPKVYEKEVDSSEVHEILQYVGFNKVRMEKGKLVKEDPRIQLDFNAIAQGYSVDVLCRFLNGKGIEDMVVEIGGELRAKGNNAQGRPWTVGIDKPVPGSEYIKGDERYQAIISLKDKALATSGNYRKYHERDGIKVSHTIEPSTGFPVERSLLSATVITANCMTADAYATAFMVLGLDGAKVILNKHPELEAYLIYADDKGEFQTFATEGIKEFIKQ